MNALSIERSAAYLNLHLTHSGPGGEPSPAGPYITLSRESGTGATALAGALAERLSAAPHAHAWSVYSGNLIAEMLRSNHLPAHLARFLPEDRIGEVDASVGEIIGLHPDLWSLVHKTNDLLRDLAHAGNAILVGRGANFATAGIPHGVHVRLVASENTRAQRSARWLALSAAAARAHNAERDAARRRYVRAHFGADVADPTAYDFVFNIERVPLAAIVDFIAQRVAQEVAAGSPAHSRAHPAHVPAGG